MTRSRAELRGPLSIWSGMCYGSIGTGHWSPGSPFLSPGHLAEDSPLTSSCPQGRSLIVTGFLGRLPWRHPQLQPPAPRDSLLPHEAQEHQQEQADKPPSSGKGLGHGERASAHDEVKHVHQSNLEPTGATLKARNESTSPRNGPQG